MLSALQVQRTRVAAEFGELLAPRKRDIAPGALTAYWRALPQAGEAETLAAAGFVEAVNADAVSYTHLDVYKRQPYGLPTGARHPVRSAVRRQTAA